MRRTPWFLVHSKFCSKRSTFHRHYTSSDGFIKCGELANFLRKMQFFPDFSANLWPLNSVLLCVLTSLTWCGPPGVRQCFDTIHFFRRHNFAVCLCHVFSRVSLHRGGGSCPDYDSIVGLPICRALLMSFLNYGELNCHFGAQRFKSLWLSHLALLYQFDIHFNRGTRHTNSHFCLFLCVSRYTMFFFFTPYIKHWLTAHVSSLRVLCWLNGVIFIY